MYDMQLILQACVQSPVGQQVPRSARRLVLPRWQKKRGRQMLCAPAQPADQASRFGLALTRGSLVLPAVNRMLTWELLHNVPRTGLAGDALFHAITLISHRAFQQP